MTLAFAGASDRTTDWLFAVARDSELPVIDGLVSTRDYDRSRMTPDQVAVMEKARKYNARAVFFEAGRHGRAPIPQALVFDVRDHPDDAGFAELHKRLWSWGGVPLVYRTAPGVIQLFRCAHEPDFVGGDAVPVCRPIRTLTLGTRIAESDHEAALWDASRIRNGTIWDDPVSCALMLSGQKSAHRNLVEEVRALADKLNAQSMLEPGLRRRLLILSLLIAYLEERSVLLAEDFARALPGANTFFEVLADGSALIALLANLEDRFNGHVFSLTQEERNALTASTDLKEFARLVEGFENASGQMALWRLYSFRDLPVELISNIYQLFVKDTASSIYTPPALVRLILDEALSWSRLDELMAGDGVILDPACGSGVFLVEAYKRLILHWRAANKWEQPDVDTLRGLMGRIHGIDLEDGAVELAAFSLCLSLCDALEPEDIRSSVKLFPGLADVTLHSRCFFEAREHNLITAPIAVIVGNPPFESALTTPGAQRSYAAFNREVQASGGSPLADKQLAYLFLHDAMQMLSANGILAMIEPAGFLYNQQSMSLRQGFFKRWRVREILDFVSVRGLFKKGSADPKIVVVIAESSEPGPEDRLLHAVFRRNGRAAAEQGFDIDAYDLHWLRNADAVISRDAWRANLLGGPRVRKLLERLRTFPTLLDYARKQGWDFGEGFIAGAKGISRPAGHLIGKPLLPTQALSERGLETQFLDRVPDVPIKDTKTPARFTPPLLLIKEHQDLHSGLWTDHYLTYKHEIVGLAAPVADLPKLAAIKRWLDRESVVLRAFVAGISARLYTQRATAILGADIYAIPYVENGDLDISPNEGILAEDIVEYQREFVRLGAGSRVMGYARPEILTRFDEVLLSQINAVYPRKPLKVLPGQRWSGAVCQAYVFGDGEVDWGGADELRDRLDGLLKERRAGGLSITRITRVYDRNFVFLLKPSQHRFWTRSIALRDADDILADLRAQGF